MKRYKLKEWARVTLTITLIVSLVIGLCLDLNSIASIGLALIMLVLTIGSLIILYIDEDGWHF